jgi:hypothetical protein
MIGSYMHQNYPQTCPVVILLHDLQESSFAYIPNSQENLKNIDPVIFVLEKTSCMRTLHRLQETTMNLVHKNPWNNRRATWKVFLIQPQNRQHGSLRMLWFQAVATASGDESQPGQAGRRLQQAKKARPILGLVLLRCRVGLACWCSRLISFAIRALSGFSAKEFSMQTCKRASVAVESQSRVVSRWMVRSCPPPFDGNSIMLSRVESRCLQVWV